MRPKIDLSDFSFTPAGFGHYLVKYTSPVTGKTWDRVVNWIWLIDETRGAEQPKRKNLERLKRLIKDGQ